VQRQGGYTLLEMMTVVAIIGLFVGIAYPNLESMRRRSAVRAVSADLRSIFRRVRSRAISRAVNSGVKFTTNGDGQWNFTIYDDGDGDGVRNNDIAQGIDRRVSMPQPVLNAKQIAGIALPFRRIADPDGGWMATTASAVQFGSSTICSFSPNGTSTAGTIYISDRGGELFGLRVYGVTAKIRLIHYDFRTARWEER
jgi:prepilin-type N-terminal cleavage/methylation domain-containing protein